ncbi:MAG: RNA polymerase sigma factor [Spirochaetes bacterium]|nr:RNA polymerase sigma factor [Spirochaetota bacterium]
MTKKYFNSIFIYYKQNFMRYACFLSRKHCDAEDLVQEAYLQALKKIKTLKKTDSFKAWILTIIRNLYFNDWRKRSKIEFINPVIDEDKLSELSDNRFLPDKIIFINNSKKELRKALLRIPKFYRNPVILRGIEGMRYDDISRIENISIGTVRSRINRGRKLLKKQLRLIVCEDRLNSFKKK